MTRKPGHYVEPVLSPDGAHVVYRATSDGYLRSPQWSRRPGLYVVASKGGEPRRIAKSGRAPHFGTASDRVYFTAIEGDDDDKRTLRSIALEGSDPRDHQRGVYFTDIQVSPDGRWVAFAQGGNAHVTPFVSAGLPADIAPGGKALPTRRVSRDAAG